MCSYLKHILFTMVKTKQNKNNNNNKNFKQKVPV